MARWRACPRLSYGTATSRLRGMPALAALGLHPLSHIYPLVFSLTPMQPAWLPTTPWPLPDHSPNYAKHYTPRLRAYPRHDFRICNHPLTAEALLLSDAMAIIRALPTDRGILGFLSIRWKGSIDSSLPPCISVRSSIFHLPCANLFY
ncbi:MAG: hypothetical protein FRX48_06578 [Lasallia pustulata]|uniref:Uncharacterized protein n=1 Tax=Lasallia pustulata TaxID=136370 RepID=A0A5M8PNA7_9LECA|nr:MAG: hypothetical protein FRX48_06578 [Lasallia pustulata]